MRRTSYAMGAAALLALCAAGSARADFSERDPEALSRAHLAAGDPRRLDLRLGVSFGWLVDAANGSTLTAGLFPVELGVGYRLTGNVSMGLFGRLGLIHYGGGLELVTMPGGDWSRDGVALRVAAVVIRDGASCFYVGDGPPPPCNAIFALAEVGLQYHLVEGRGFSVELALQAGSRWRTRDSVTTSQVVFGVIGPRFVSEF